MEYECKKVANCFKDAQTFEYRLPVRCQQMLGLLSALGEVQQNDAFRRPLFSLETRDALRIKGILRERVLRVSYPEDRWQGAKEAFERWLSEQSPLCDEEQRPDQSQ